MRRFVLCLSFLLLGSMVAPAAITTPESENVLIVYLSRTNNTKVLAEIIHSQVGGELIALELKEPYPENYEQIVKQVARENETGFLPTLKTEIEDIAKYDVIFIGFPTWGMQLPPPIKSFLKQHDFRGKVVVPFNSNGGYGAGSSFQTVREMCPMSKVLEGYSVKGGNEKDGVMLGLRDARAEQARDEVKRWLGRSLITN